jgi:hypothetical protein
MFDSVLINLNLHSPKLFPLNPKSNCFNHLLLFINWLKFNWLASIYDILKFQILISINLIFVQSLKWGKEPYIILNRKAMLSHILAKHILPILQYLLVNHVIRFCS